jgi:curved DNA-binding protein CbpA
MDNHYAVLNVAMDASEAVVRAAYRVLAAQFHPDRHAADPAMLQRMQQVTAAYRVLSDPRLRADHDADLQRLRRRRVEDGDAAHCLTVDVPPTMADAVADAECERERALAHRRAVAAAAYAGHAALG